MPPKSNGKVFTVGSYEVYEDGIDVVLRVGNSGIRFTWDAAIRISSKLRVFQRDAQEYVGMSRELQDVDPEERTANARQKVVRLSSVVQEGGYKVFTRGPDTILEVGNGELAMAPDMARNISVWLADSGERVRAKHFPDMTLRFMIANLTDASEQERIRQQRRDATAKFG